MGWCTPSAHSSVPERIAVRRPITSIARCTVRLFSWAMSGGTSAMRSAIASTSSSRRSAGNTRLAQPRRTASSPEIQSPVSIISMAARGPRNQAWNCMSGTPKRTAGYPMRASSDT